MVIAQITTDNRENFREYEKPEPYFGTAPAALLQGFKELSEVTVHVLCCTQQPMRAPEKLEPNIWFHSLLVPKTGWLRTGYQGCIRAVRKKLRHLRPDIVHGQGTERDCAISAVFSGFPNVITIHGNMRMIEKVNRPRPFTYGWLAARLEAFTIPRSRGVVCITRYTERAVSDLARRTWVVPNAVDGSFFEVERAPTTPPVLLCAGNVTVRKNQNAFIRALDNVPGKEKLRVLFLGGASETDPYVREFFSLLSTRPWCIYGGFADRHQLRKHFSEAAAVVLPSLEDNCPMVVLEAMAAGVPVAAANVGGVPELAEHDRTAWLFDPADPAAMAEAVQVIVHDAPRTAAFVRRAKAHARETFHPLAIARKHIEIYGAVLSTRS